MNRSRRKPMPWGRISGMLVASIVTVVCVLQRIEPLEILRRSAIAFVFVAVVVAFFAAALRNTSKTPRRLVR